jgi:hypothetical protein
MRLPTIPCRELLHQQEQRAAQMKQLLQKDMHIKLAFAAHMMGRCTYTQVTCSKRPSHKQEIVAA